MPAAVEKASLLANQFGLSAEQFLSFTKQLSKEEIILLSCLHTPMTTAEVIKFAELVGKELSTIPTYRYLRESVRLSDDDWRDNSEIMFSMINPLTYVRRGDNQFELSERIGWLTTQSGLSRVAPKFTKQ